MGSVPILGSTGGRLGCCRSLSSDVSATPLRILIILALLVAAVVTLAAHSLTSVGGNAFANSNFGGGGLFRPSRTSVRVKSASFAASTAASAPSTTRAAATCKLREHGLSGQSNTTSVDAPQRHIARTRAWLRRISNLSSVLDRTVLHCSDDEAGIVMGGRSNSLAGGPETTPHAQQVVVDDAGDRVDDGGNAKVRQRSQPDDSELGAEQTSVSADEEAELNTRIDSSSSTQAASLSEAERKAKELAAVIAASVAASGRSCMVQNACLDSWNRWVFYTGEQDDVDDVDDGEPEAGGPRCIGAACDGKPFLRLLPLRFEEGQLMMRPVVMRGEPGMLPRPPNVTSEETGSSSPSKTPAPPKPPVRWFEDSSPAFTQLRHYPTNYFHAVS